MALKMILREIDPFAFENAQHLDLEKKKAYSIKQSDSDRSLLDSKWDQINSGLKQIYPTYEQPQSILFN